MILARIHQGRVEPQDPIPEECEGCLVQMSPAPTGEPMEAEAWLSALRQLLSRLDKTLDKLAERP
jgi:hypothetical protein